MLAFWLLVQSLWVHMCPVSWFFRFICGVLDFSGSFNPSSSSSIRLPKLYLMFVCGSLHLFPAAGWRSIMLGSCLQVSQNIICPGLDFSLSHVMVLKLGHSLIGHSLNLCSIFIPAYLVGSTNFGLKVLWLGWFPYPIIGSLSWLEEVAISGSISPVARSLS